MIPLEERNILLRVFRKMIDDGWITKNDDLTIDALVTAICEAYKEIEEWRDHGRLFELLSKYYPEKLDTFKRLGGGKE